MQTGAATKRDRTAIGGSIAIHACVLALVASLPAVHAAYPGTVDETSVTTQPVRIEYRPHARSGDRDARPLDRPSAPLHVLHRIPTVAHAAVTIPEESVPVLTIEAPARPQPAATAQRAATPLPVAAAAAAAPLPATTAPPSPSPTPSATAAAGGIGSLAEDWPARAKPDIVADLAAGAHGHAVVRILVDEHGRAEQVTVVAGALDDATRALLAAATYIPARCNGLDCEGEATLRF